MTDQMVWIRDLARERKQYIERYGEDPPSTLPQSWSSQFIGQQMAHAIERGERWEDDYYLGDPVHLLRAMREQMPKEWVDLQIERALFKVEFGLKHGIPALTLRDNLEGAIYDIGFRPNETPGYPGAPLPLLDGEVAPTSPPAAAPVSGEGVDVAAEPEVSEDDRARREIEARLRESAEEPEDDSAALTAAAEDIAVSLGTKRTIRLLKLIRDVLEEEI